MLAAVVPEDLVLELPSTDAVEVQLALEYPVVDAATPVGGCLGEVLGHIEAASEAVRLQLVTVDPIYRLSVDLQLEDEAAEVDAVVCSITCWVR